MPTENGHTIVPVHKDKLSTWQPAAKHLQVKQYRDYGSYVDTQKSKLDGRPGWCEKQSRSMYLRLLDWLPQLKVTSRGTTALCLGARLGGEVQAFVELGCFAVGIDLNPGSESKHVLHGDFHDIQFIDRTIDLVYCNCVDHVHDIEKFMAEILRVLKYGGTFLIQAKLGTNERGGSDHWDCLEWDSAKNLGSYIGQQGFKLERSGIERVFRGMPFWFLYTKR